MPTTVTKSIGTTGRDYSTIQAWEDACPANLVTADQIWLGECYNDSEFTAGATFSGVTVDSTRYLELTVAAGQSCWDHASVRTNPLKYDQSKGVGINSSAATLFDAQTARMRISRLQIKLTANQAVCVRKTTGNEGLNMTLKDILVEATDEPHNSVPLFFVGNSLCVNVIGFLRGANNGNGVFGIYTGGNTFIGCAAIRSSDRSAAGTAWRQVHAASKDTLISCVAFGFATAGFDIHANSKNCATQLASFGAGSNHQVSVTFNTTTPFTNADKDSLDLRSIAGTALAGNGFKDATNAPNDISGTVRAATPTIGAWELAAASDTLMGQAVM